MKNLRLGRWLAVAVLAVCAFVPRYQLAGKIPAVQPQWSVRAQWFWKALSEGNLQDTYLAPHPGLTVMWYAGAAQRLSGDETLYGRTVAASRANALVATLLILLAAWLVKRILEIDGVEEAGALAFFFGLVLAFNPFLILLTGLIGLDGPVSLMMLVAFLLMVIQLRKGSRGTLLAAGVGTGLAVATKVPGLLLLPAPLLLWLVDLPSRRIPWRRVMMTLLVMVAGAAVITWILLPASWGSPLRIGQDLLMGKGTRDESLREVMTRGHLQFFMGSTSRNPGMLFHPIQLLYRTTPLVLLGSLLGLLTPAFRRNRLVREAAIFLVLILIGLTVTEKKTWRYICPAVVMLDLIGAVGFWLFLKHLGVRWQRPAIAALVWVFLVVQGVWSVSAAPYYELRFNPVLGGPRTAAKMISVGAGEGLEQVLAFLEEKAKGLNRTLTWSGGYGSHPQKRKALEFRSDWLEWIGKSPKRTKADCHVFYIAEIQRGALKQKRADRYWLENGTEVLVVEEFGVELARVKCREGLGQSSPPSAASFFKPAPVSEDALPPAVVLITLDTTRADHMSVYGYERPTTPFLEQFASEGLRVQTAVSPMPTTDPSHLTMFTGLHPRSHGSLRNGVPLRDPSRPNLVGWLGGLGYETGAFVSRKHLVPSSLKLRGFEIEDGPDGPVRDGGETIAKALAWTKDKAEGRFFVWLHLFDPHFPYDPPQPYRSEFVNADSEWPVPLHHRFPDPFPEEFMETLSQRYDAEIRYVDSLVERFVEEIRPLMPGGRSPLIIVAGDHGEALDELWDRYDVAFDHGQLLSQGQLRVPLVIWWPDRIVAGAVVAKAAGLVDIAPTLFQLLERQGFPTQGNSLFAEPGLAFSQRRARMKRDQPSAKAWRKEGREIFSVQDGRYKLDLFLSIDQERTELYDVVLDPEERNDLSAAHPVVHDRLFVAVKQWLETTPWTGAVEEIPEEKLEALRALGYLD